MINEIIKKNGIAYGISLGIILALITATMYAIDLKLFVSGWIGVSTFVIYLVIGILLLVKTKKDLNDFLSFKDAFTTYFIAVLAALLISTLFSVLLFNVIDPGAKETISEHLIKYMAETLQKFGTPASAINEALAKMKETSPFSTLEQLKGLAFSLALYSILGLILAAFFKSKTTQE
jgi:membrane-bound ClpP family serine protease